MTNCYDPECFRDQHPATTEHNFGLDGTGRSGLLTEFFEGTSAAALDAWGVYSELLRMKGEPIDQSAQDLFTAGFDAAANRVKNRVNEYAYESEPGPAVSALAVLDSFEPQVEATQVDGAVD